MTKLFLIALGAIPGALLRWKLNNDLIGNIFGTFIIGFITGYNIRGNRQIIIGFGFCGAFTTFSSWIFRCMILLSKGYLFQAFVLVFEYISLGLLAVSIGFFIGSKAKKLMHHQLL